MGTSPSGPGTGYPPICTWDGVHPPSKPEMGVPPYQQDGVPPPLIPPGPGMGISPVNKMGYASPTWTWDDVPPPSGPGTGYPPSDPGMGYTSHPDLRWGYPVSRMGYSHPSSCIDLGLVYPPVSRMGYLPPTWTWDGVPPIWTWDGVHPPSRPEMGYPPISRMGYPHPHPTWTWDGVPPIQTLDGVPPSRCGLTN